MTGKIMFHDGQDSNSAKRLIEVSDRDIRAARRLLILLAQNSHLSDLDLSNPAPTKLVADTSTSAMLDRARAEFESRRRRARFFGRAMFGEPAWDMLLALYLQHASGPRQTVGSLMQFAGTSPTTGKRWLDVLAGYGLVAKEAHPNDARSYYIRLTEKAREKLNAYFSETIDKPV